LQKKKQDNQEDMIEIIKSIVILCITLPVLMLVDGCKRWSKYFNEDDPVGAFLWTLLVILIFVLVALLIMGYS
jgi:magnesium-transporting ATPase (P-type)